MNLIIESSDSYGEKTIEKVSCQKEISSKGVKYLYKNEHGECKIFILEDSVRIMRRGLINSSQTFKIGTDTPFKYQTPYTTSDFILKTLKIQRGKNDILISYEIYEQDSKINDIVVKIKEISS